MATLAGCAATGRPHVVKPAQEHEKAALIERVKSLAGTWEMTGENGAPVVASVYELSSNGSAVREIMFPGTPHEMTNMYHMDGPELVMTHYCAEGNQPRMRARTDGGKAGEIRFARDSVANLRSPDETYMGEMTLVFEDADHIRQEWWSYTGEQRGAQPAVFRLTRRDRDPARP